MSGRPPRRPNPPQGGGSSAPTGPSRPPGTSPPAGGSPADSVTRPSRPPGGGSDAGPVTRPSRPDAGGTGTGIQNPGGVGNRGRLAGIGAVVGGLGLAVGPVAGLVFGLRGADTVDNIVESVTEIVQNPYFLAVAGGIVVVFVMRKK